MKTEQEQIEAVTMAIAREVCPYYNRGRCDLGSPTCHKTSIQLCSRKEAIVDSLNRIVKQAKIDVLNELKEKKSIDKPHANLEALKASLSQSGPTYSPERLQADIRSLSSTMTIWDIDEMIKEIENDRIR